jgi:hypothetical protein
MAARLIGWRCAFLQEVRMGRSAPRQRQHHDDAETRALQESRHPDERERAQSDRRTQPIDHSWFGHTIWPTDNHETVHLYSSTIGRMTPLFNEGLAVAFQVDPVRGDMTPRWNNRHVHDIAASLRAAGRLVPLASLLTIHGWRGVDSQVSYPVAGSFVRYLLDVQGGIGLVRQLFAGSTQTDPPALVRSKVEAAYGRTPDALEADWLAFLDARR